MNDAEQPAASAVDRGVQPARWVTRIVIALVVVVVAYLAWRASAAFFPRWWAQRVADQSQGSFVRGTSWGLFYGFVFTAIPLLVLFQVRRRFLSWVWRGVVVAVAFVLALPNWLTLSIVFGISNAAIAGDSILDNDAPGFRWATLWGALLGAVLAVGLTATSLWLRHRKTQVEQLRGERDELRSRQRPDEP